MPQDGRRVEFYGLSTCGWCRRTKAWLDDHGIDYELVYVDLAQGDELASAKKRIHEFLERESFPILIINNGEKVIQGYQVDDFEEALG
jgi:glutaredoxin-like protein NrdH